MMSSAIENPTEIRTNRQCILLGISLEESRFATVPMQAARPSWMSTGELDEKHFATVPMVAVHCTRTSQREQEEAWHTSFEQAISERAARVSQQLRRLSTTALDRALPGTDPLPTSPRADPPHARVVPGWNASGQSFFSV